MSKVYFADASAKNKKSLLEKLEVLAIKAGIKEVVDEGDFVAVKTHFGESGNTAFVPAIYFRRVIGQIKQAGGKPFLTDTNTLYKGSRSNAVDHLQTAYEHGFTFGSIGAPVIIADGLSGKDFMTVQIKGRHFNEVKISSAVINANALVTVSHFKGHEMTGFGGALKNLGMGTGSPGAKQMMHSGALPEVLIDKCTACGKCAEWCPTDAISVSDKASIDKEKCYSCGECAVTCPYWAITIKWETAPEEMQQKIVEHALGALSGKQEKSLFFNFLLNITPDCDCWGWSDKAITHDIGILASKDLVAVDMASIDLLNEATGKDKIKEIWPETNHMEQIRYAEKTGLGTASYKLVKVTG